MAKKRMSFAAATKSIAKRENISVKQAAGILTAANKQHAKDRKSKKNAKKRTV